MAFDLHIDPEHAFGLITWRRTVDGVQIKEAMRALFEHPQWQPGFRHLWDGRAIHVLSLDLVDLRAVGTQLRLMRPKMGNGRAATILPVDTHWAVGRLLVAYSRLSLPEVKICHHLDEAAAWIGVEVELLAS